MDERISVNSLSIGAGSLVANVTIAARLCVAAISPTIEEIDECGVASAQAVLQDAGLAVATLTHRAFGFATDEEARAARARLDRTIDIAAAIGADSITFTTGGRGALSWPEAAARFEDSIASCADRARAAGVALALEPTSHLYADASIAHRLHDTVSLAKRAGIALGIDLFACWFDADIDAAIIAAAPLCRLVQVSDYVAGDRGLPCRAVPGDGMVPLDRLIPAIVAAGYRGRFDVEVIGPRVAVEGALERAIARLDRILSDAGLPQ